jgi:hypothetical protein
VYLYFSPSLSLLPLFPPILIFAGIEQLVVLMLMVMMVVVVVVVVMVRKDVGSSG